MKEWQQIIMRNRKNMSLLQIEYGEYKIARLSSQRLLKFIITVRSSFGLEGIKQAECNSDFYNVNFMYSTRSNAI